MAYDWKKTFKKIATTGIVILLAGLASVYGNSHWYLAAVPVFEGIKNYIKHWND